MGKNNVKDVVIKDRVMLAQEGIFVIIALIDIKTGKIIKSPDIISRGFIYLKESQDLLRQVRILIKKNWRHHRQNASHQFWLCENIVREDIGRFLYQKTNNRPIVLPVLIEV